MTLLGKFSKEPPELVPGHFEERMKPRKKSKQASRNSTPKIKRLLVFLGVITVLALVLFGVGIGYAVYISNEFAPSGQAYADESIRAIITTWSEDELIKRVSPEFRAITTQSQLDQFFGNLNKLGRFQSYGGAQGKVDVTFNTKKGVIITATYHATGTFQYGKANIIVKLIRYNNTWQIAGFHVDPAPFYSL